MPVTPLPSKPDLNHLKHQAKDLLKGHAAHRSETAQIIREFHPRFANMNDSAILAASLSLHDAQLTIARQHGFPSWPRLKARIEKPTLAHRLDLPHHERIEDREFRHAVELLDAGDAEGLRLHLQQHPELARRRVTFEGGNYFRNPTLLEFVAENPTRRGKLPKSIPEVARVILDSGTTQGELDETLLLVASSLIARQSGVQAALINLLCDYGANPDAAARTAAIYSEFDAVKQLISRGAKVDLPLAAVLGGVEEARKLLPQASPDDRHWAVALASQFGYVNIVRLLLDAGESPNRFNPVGGHSHSTPLHQAAASGDLELAKLLVEHGARLDLRDTMWHATPAEWAKHEDKPDVERYLLERQQSSGGGELK